MRYSALRTRLSSRILWFAFLTVLAAGGAAAPFQIAAQQQAAPTQPQPTGQSSAAPVQTSDTAKPEAAKPEENETDKFRHNPLVTAAAKALHLPVETTARTFEFINFAIIVLAIGIPLARFLPKFLRQRAEKVRTDIESARKVTEDANARLSAIEAKLSGLGDEIQKFRSEVEEEMHQDEARIRTALEEESARIVVAAEQEIGSAAAQAKRGLRHFAVDLAIEQAARQMLLTPETDRSLIAEFVGDTNKNGAAKGGQN